MGRKLGNDRGKIVGNKEVIEMIDIDTEKTVRGKYTLGLDEVVDDGEMPF